MGFGFRLGRVLALAILVGISSCVFSGGEGSLGGEPGPNLGRDLADDRELAQLITGSWVVSGEDLPRELSSFFESDWELHVEIAAAGEEFEMAGGISVRTQDCSFIGGPVSSFDPLVFPPTTMAGIGDCGAQDTASRVFLNRIEGGSFVLAGETLVISVDELTVELARS